MTLEISIHALLAESDGFALAHLFQLSISIHALLAESDFDCKYDLFPCLRFLSTLSLRRATSTGRRVEPRGAISIHALLAESDRIAPAVLATYLISIHALLAESDAQATIRNTYRWQFLSTLSLRRATALPPRLAKRPCDFYPRSPCGERHAHAVRGFDGLPISIHALLAESDGIQSGAQQATAISIHALLAESDNPLQWDITRQYPFLSTLSLRRATG